MFDWLLRVVLLGCVVWFVLLDDPKKYLKLEILIGVVFLVTIAILILAYATYPSKEEKYKSEEENYEL